MKVGILLAILPGLACIQAAAGAGPNRITWLRDESKALQEARKSGKGLLVEFRAEWCAACKMMDRHTWTDPLVQREIATHFVALSFDLTKETEADEAVARRYLVAGLPTVVIVDCKRSGEGPARVTGYASAHEMLEQLRRME